MLLIACLIFEAESIGGNSPISFHSKRERCFKFHTMEGEASKQCFAPLDETRKGKTLIKQTRAQSPPIPMRNLTRFVSHTPRKGMKRFFWFRYEPSILIPVSETALLNSTIYRHFFSERAARRGGGALPDFFFFFFFSLFSRPRAGLATM